MASKRKPDQHRSRPSSGAVVLRSAKGGGWEFVPPRCARERADDMEEVNAILEAGEVDIAIDELRWLLDGCSDFIEAHSLLGQLHLEHDRDLTLARAHFGYAFQIGLTAWRRAGRPGILPYGLPANRPFFEAGKGLAWCLKELGKLEMAQEILGQMLELDPADPLNAREMREQWEKSS